MLNITNPGTTRFPIGERGATVLVFLAMLAIGILLFLIYDRSPVLALGTFLSLLAAAYLIVRPTHIGAFHLTVLTLPLLSAFVINIGGNLRVPYLFATLALLLALHKGQLRLPNPNLPLVILAAFVLYACISVAFAVRFDISEGVIPFGFRTSTFRPLIQAGQLFLMLVFFILTINFTSSERRLLQITSLICASIFIVVIYGTYEIATVFFDLPFFNINTNPDFIGNRYAGTQLTAVGDILVPRPRSTLLEPINMAAYILFALPFTVALLAYQKHRLTRWLIWGIIGLALLLFFLSFSRTAFVAAIALTPLVLLLIRSNIVRLKLVLAGALAYLAVALVIFPALGTQPSLSTPVVLLYERLETLTSFKASVELDPVAIDRIGRGYYYPIEVFKNNPLFGVGLGSYPFALAELTESPVQASSSGSIYLQLLTEVGIIGTFLFLAFVAIILWRLVLSTMRNKDHHLRPIAVASIISIAGVMLVNVGLASLTTDSYIWVLLAIGLVVPHFMRAPATIPSSGDLTD